MIVQSPSTNLFFRGKKTTETAARDHQRAAQLRGLLNQEGDPYVGESPEPLRAQMKVSETRLRRILDNFANQLQKRPNHPKSALKKSMAEEGQTASVAIRKIGEGRMGRVYKLGTSPDAYALKVFICSEKSIVEERDLADAPFREAANGIFLTHRNTSDVSRFYLANPFEGWTLTEYIGKRHKLESRSGKTLKAQNLYLDDTGNKRNFVNDIRVDHGDHLIDLGKCPSNVTWIGLTVC